MNIVTVQQDASGEVQRVAVEVLAAALVSLTQEDRLLVVSTLR